MILLFTLLGSIVSVPAQERVPAKLSFQGYVEDANGVPLGDAAPKNHTVLFKIFNAPVDGSLLWTETQVVTFDKGNYSVLLGQVALQSLSQVVITNASELYVETTVTLPNGTPETILPRLQLLPSPYAFLAQRAVEADWAVRATNANNADEAFRATWARSATNADDALRATWAKTATNALGLSGFLAVTNIANDSIPAAKLEPTLRTNLVGPIDPSRLPSNLALKTASNNFTANQRIEGDLTVTNVNLGGGGQLQAMAGPGSLRLITGTLPGSNSPDYPTTPPTPALPLNGDGWTAVPYPTTSVFPNSWRITFNPPFKQVPIVVCSWHLGGNRTVVNAPDLACVTSAVTTTTVDVFANQQADGTSATNPALPPYTLQYLNVNFIAIGLR